MPSSLQVVQRGGPEERHGLANHLQADPIFLWLCGRPPPRPERAQEQEPGQPGGGALHVCQVCVFNGESSPYCIACLGALVLPLLRRPADND